MKAFRWQLCKTLRHSGSNERSDIEKPATRHLAGRRLKWPNGIQNVSQELRAISGFLRQLCREIQILGFLYYRRECFIVGEIPHIKEQSKNLESAIHL